jgi:YfiH family protein
MFLTADTLAHLPGLRHGFFTRQGGVSGGLYASLNCGPGSQDDLAHVTENRARAAQALGASPSSLCTLYQVHGAEVVTVREPWPADARPQADAMVTDRPGLMLGILTADCVPVLLVDPKARIIGAAHAGWKGAIVGVTNATVEAMEALGGWRDRMIAAIGPAIGWHCYEVDAAFLRRFLDADMANEQFFREGAGEGKYLFNVKGYVAQRLAQAGIHHIQMLGNDTYKEEENFFSFRRTTHRQEADYGRQLSAIMLEE